MAVKVRADISLNRAWPKAARHIWQLYQSATQLVEGELIAFLTRHLPDVVSEVVKSDVVLPLVFSPFSVRFAH